MSGVRFGRSTFLVIWVFGFFLVCPGLIGMSAAQTLQTDSLSEAEKVPQSETSGKIIPFAGYEERLRQSPRWKSLTPEEQATLLEKLEATRKQFLDQQEQLNAQYEDRIKKMKKRRESLVDKRRKRAQYQDVDQLWGQFQSLPIDKRMAMERQLGLNDIAPSRQRGQFQKRLDGLSLAKKNYILQQLQQVSP